MVISLFDCISQTNKAARDWTSISHKKAYKSNGLHSDDEFSSKISKHIRPQNHVSRQTIVINQSLLEILPKIAGFSLSNRFSKSYMVKKNLSYPKRCLQVNGLQIKVLQSNINSAFLPVPMSMVLRYYHEL